MVILIVEPELAFSLTSLRWVRRARLLTSKGGETMVTWRHSSRGQQLIREFRTWPGTFGSSTFLRAENLLATLRRSCQVWSRSFTKIIFLRSMLEDCV